jgi:tetratricopeptide (TPR) repeat protein
MPEAGFQTANLKPSSRSDGISPWWPRLAAVAILGATLLAYLPALGGGLLWDDGAHITSPRLQSAHGLWDIWFRLGATQQYYPVLHTAFWIEHRIWADSVLGYHLANVVLHASAACLFALVLARLRPTGPGWPWPAWFAAAVFALHPVCVESVAWISEQKNTLSLVFYLLSALVYLQFDRDRRLGRYFLALGFFVLALLSKSVTATLPAALLLLLALRRPSLAFRRDIVPLLPWFAAGICSGLFTAWVERNFIGAKGEAFNLGLVERCFLAGRVVWFYLGKLFWPSPLAFIYPRWQVAGTWAWSLGIVALAAAVACLWAMRKWSRAPLVALLFFVGSLVPALGFVNVYPFLFSYVADHFQYLACLGIIALVADGGADVAREFCRHRLGGARAAARFAAIASGAAVLAVLFILTRRQSYHYRDAGALYEDTLAKNPGCWMAENNFGVYLMDRGEWDGSIAHLRRAVSLRPAYSDAHNNLGNALSKLPGHSAEAVSEFEEALRLEPGMAQAHANLGLALSNEPGRRGEGIAELRAALRGNEDNPDYARAHADLAVALSQEPGNFPEAFAQFQEALRLTPDSAGTRDSFGIALARAGRPFEAVEQFELAVRLSPENPEFHNNLGGILTLLGRGREAIAEFREAIRLNPGFAGAHFNLGRALRKVGDGQEAVAEHREAERLAPGSAEIRSSLGSIFFRLGKMQDAIAEYREATRLEPASAPYHFNLGVALSASGSIDESIREFRRALQLNPDYSDAHFNLAVALKKSGRGDEAEAEFTASGRRP